MIRRALVRTIRHGPEWAWGWFNYGVWARRCQNSTDSRATLELPAAGEPCRCAVALAAMKPQRKGSRVRENLIKYKWLYSMKVFDAVWRIALACAGIYVVVNGFGAICAAYAVSRGAPSDTDAWFWLVIGIVELIVAAVCVLPAWSRFWLKL